MSGRAFNPMVNAGAIVTATLVSGHTRDEQFDRILDGLSSFAGRDLAVDEDVCASERDTGDRNRAIAYLMRSAGLMDYRVGMPAKSGVSGAISAALPGQMGLAAHSPLLDPRGNSVRGVAACEQIAERLGLHLLLPGERARPGLRRTYRGVTVHSKRARVAPERAVLEAEGSLIAVHELGASPDSAGAAA